MTACIVYDDVMGDPIVDVLQENSLDVVQSRKLSDFCAESGLSYDGMSGRLCRVKDASPFSLIIDRVVEISRVTLDTIAGDGSLERGQLFSAYEQIKSGISPQAPSCQYSLVGRLLPLPTQWHLVAQMLPVATPSFKYGYGPEMIETGTFLNPVHKSPFDLYQWKTNERAEGVIWDEFVVERPRGQAVLSYKVSDKVIVESLEGKATSSSALENIKAMSASILTLFDASMGEILWFVDDSDVTFAAFSHFLAGAASRSSFNPQARDFLSKLH